MKNYVTGHEYSEMTHEAKCRYHYDKLVAAGELDMTFDEYLRENYRGYCCTCSRCCIIPKDYEAWLSS